MWNWKFTCARTALSGTHNKAENRAELVPYLNWTAGMCANRKRNGARSSATFFGSNDDFKLVAPAILHCCWGCFGLIFLPRTDELTLGLFLVSSLRLETQRVT